MKTVSEAYAREHLAEIFDSVLDLREGVVIDRAGRDAVVVVALADYESSRETLHLLEEPVDARRLLASIERLESGPGAESSIC